MTNLLVSLLDKAGVEGRQARRQHRAGSTSIRWREAVDAHMIARLGAIGPGRPDRRGRGVGLRRRAVNRRRCVEAVKAGNVDAVRAIARRSDADVNAAEVDGTTALHWAAHFDNLAAADLADQGRRERCRPPIATA